MSAEEIECAPLSDGRPVPSDGIFNPEEGQRLHGLSWSSSTNCWSRFTTARTGARRPANSGQPAIRTTKYVVLVTSIGPLATPNRRGWEWIGRRQREGPGRRGQIRVISRSMRRTLFALLGAYVLDTDTQFREPGTPNRSGI